MERIKCTPSPDCPEFLRGCFEDTHHPIRPRSSIKGDLMREAHKLTAYETCRRVHREVEAVSPIPNLTHDELATIVNTGGTVLPHCLQVEYETAVQIADGYRYDNAG